VLVYFRLDFFSNNSDDFGIVSLRMLPPRFRSPASFAIRALGSQPPCLLLLN